MSSDGGFDDVKPLYASGERCPGRIPWQSNCDSSNISSWSLAADTEFTITGTRTYDNRPASEDGLMGLEPIWCVEMDSTTPGLTLVRGVGNPVARIGHGYVNHLCADCGSTLSSLYGVGMFRCLARLVGHRGHPPRVSGESPVVIRGITTTVLRDRSTFSNCRCNSGRRYTPPCPTFSPTFVCSISRVTDSMVPVQPITG